MLYCMWGAWQEEISRDKIRGITDPKIVRRILIQRSAVHPEIRRIPTGGARVGFGLPQTSLIEYAQKKPTKNSHEDDTKH